MRQNYQRFRCVPEPSGTWAVWDFETGAAATLGGCVLNGRTEERARAACDILRRIYRNRLDASSMRQEANGSEGFLRKRRPLGLRLVQSMPYPVG